MLQEDDEAEEFPFEVSLSFAGDNKRDKIREVASKLKEKIGEKKVFFDEDYEHEFAGLDADAFFQNVYCKQTRLVVTCVCMRYGEKESTQHEWRAIRSFASENRNKPDGRSRFLPLRFDDGDLDGLFTNIDHVPDVREWTVDQIVEIIIKRHGLCAPKQSIARDGKTEVSEQAVNALIGLVRRCYDERLLSLARIAHAVLRGCLYPDLVSKSIHVHNIVAIVRSLMNDPVATHGATHPALRFCVLLCELCSEGSEIKAALQGWFQDVCVPAGYDYHAILAELPQYPDEANRYIWLDVHWLDKPQGEQLNHATAFIRCGNLQYRAIEDRSRISEEAQFAKLVRTYNASLNQTCPVNHVSAVTLRTKMLNSWDQDTNSGTLLPLPVTLREEPCQEIVECPRKLDEKTNADWDTVDNLAIRTQTCGAFVTGKLPAVHGFPCQVFNGLLNSAAVGLWTKGGVELPDDDKALRENSRVNELYDLPALIHLRRKGAVDVNSVWRRVVLFFNPNIPELLRESESPLDILQVNAQLA